jgi:hypothetical protein
MSFSASRLLDDVERVYNIRAPLLNTHKQLQHIRRELQTLAPQINYVHLMQKRNNNKQNSVQNTNSTTRRRFRHYTIQNNSDKLTEIQRKVLLFCEKLESYCVAKEMSSVFLCSKYASDCQSLVYAIQMEISTKTKDEIYAKLVGDTKMLWDQLSQIKNVDIAESVAWSDFLEVFEPYVETNIDKYNEYLNPCGYIAKEYTVTDYEFGLLRWYISSCPDHHICDIKPNNPLIQQQHINGWPLEEKIRILEHLTIYDMYNFSRDNPLLALTKIVQLESIDLTKSKNIVQNIVHAMARYSLDLSQQIKALYIDDFKTFVQKLTNGQPIQQNYEKHLRQIANNCFVAPLWIGEPSRRNYELKLKRILKYNPSAEDHVIEEFPCFYVTDVFIVDVLIVTSSKISFLDIVIPYSQILECSCIRGTRQVPSCLQITRRDGQVHQFSGIINIEECHGLVETHFNLAKAMIKLDGELEVIKTGIMYKQGQKIKSMRKRIFYLYADRLIYKENERKRELGNIPLKNVLSVEQHMTKNNVIYLTTVKRVYYFQTTTAALCKEWMQAFITTLKRTTLEYPYIWFGIYFKNQNKVFEHRTLQFDFLDGVLKIYKENEVVSTFLLKTIKSIITDKRNELHVYISFESNVYDIYLDTPQHVSIFAEICANLRIGIANIVKRNISVFLKSGFIFERVQEDMIIASSRSTKTVPVKRWISIICHQLVIFDGISFKTPIAIHSIHNMHLTKKQVLDPYVCI